MTFRHLDKIVSRFVGDNSRSNFTGWLTLLGRRDGTKNYPYLHKKQSYITRDDWLLARLVVRGGIMWADILFANAYRDNEPIEL